MKKKEIKYISNLSRKENPGDAVPWVCRECCKIQNEDGTCANIANFLCPKCWKKT